MDERYSAKLLTPKSRLLEADPDLKRAPLLESQQLRIIKADYQQSPQTFDDKIEAAKAVGLLVRQTLDFSTTSDFTPVFNTETLAKRGMANCFGYTITASECLDGAGVEHLVAYANQHTIIIVPDRKSNRLFMLDTPTKELYCEVTEAVGGADPLDQLETGELRAINSLHTNQVLKHLPSAIDRERFVDRRPWLNFSSSNMRFQDNPRDSILQMISLPSIPGRKLLAMEYNAEILRRQHRPEKAAGLMEDLSGIYLDVDSRNNLAEAGRLCRQLIGNSMGEEAVRVAMVVDESLVVGDASKNIFFLPDTKRKAASATGDAGLMEEAIELYRGLPPSKLRDEKLAKACRLSKMLQSKHN